MHEGTDMDALLAGFPVVVTIPVQWGDQDAFEHVNNVVYFRWFESARIAYFRRIGLLHRPGEVRLGTILASASCDYRRSIEFPDTVRVGIRADRVGRTSIQFAHRIVSERHAAPAAEGTSTTVAYDYAARRPHPVPDEVRAAIAELEGRPV